MSDLTNEIETIGKISEINMSDIDQTDLRYKISFSDDDISYLAHSIKETGLISSPVVRPVNDKFIIISGFNRIRAVGLNDEKQILVYQTNPDTSDCQCLVTSIASLAFKRALTPAELIRSCKRLNQFLTKQEIAQKSTAVFNRELSAQFVEELLTIGNLPDPVLQLIHSGNIALKSAKRISTFEKDAISGFINIFSSIRASSSNQLEVILHVTEIAARDRIKPEDVFKHQRIQKILLDENKDPGVKAALLRTVLFELRFPTVFVTRQRVKEKINSLKLGKQVKFVPPENFEGLDYTVSFKVRNYDEMKTNVKSLLKALDSRTLKEILK